jgi:hypothetical protein
MSYKPLLTLTGYRPRRGIWVLRLSLPVSKGQQPLYFNIAATKCVSFCNLKQPILESEAHYLFNINSWAAVVR